jgi:hypothetical protein
MGVSLARAPWPGRHGQLDLRSREAFRTSSPLQNGELKRWCVITVSLRIGPAPRRSPRPTNPCVLPGPDLRFGPAARPS